MAKNKTALLYLGSLVVWAIVFLVALRFGSTSGATWEVVSELRLPRAILASVVGMGLAMAGASLQAIFVNPLCEPYTLGISSGGALGAVLGLTFGLELSLGGVAGSAFLGSLGFTGILYLIALRLGSRQSTLLLAGVMLQFLGSSLVALWMAVADPSGISSAIYWLMGDLSRARPGGAWFLCAIVLALGALLWREWRGLDALLLGEESAQALGVPVKQVRRRLMVITCLLVGLCVSSSGMIGFIGLVVPHFARRYVSSLHFKLLPLCAIWGAIVLTVSDLLVRVFASPYELPVGVLTALVGAPVFLWIMLQKKAVV